MTKLDIAKKRVELLKGRNIKIKVNEGRNRFVYYYGYIDELYPSVFTVKSVLYGAERTLSFSYVNVLAKNVMFYPAAEEEEENRTS